MINLSNLKLGHIRLPSMSKNEIHKYIAWTGYYTRYFSALSNTAFLRHTDANKK